MGGKIRRGFRVEFWMSITPQGSKRSFHRIVWGYLTRNVRSLIYIDQCVGRISSTMLTMLKTRIGTQKDKQILAKAIREMEKPRMTKSARENDLLVVQDDTDERTVDLHAAAVVIDKS
jgi:hypothetical protein